jgi:type I restriction enzyme S subunit
MKVALADGWLRLPISEIANFGSGDPISVAKLSERSGRCPVPVFGGNGIAGYTSSATVSEPTVILGRVGQKCGVVYRNTGSAWITDNALYARRFKRPVDVRFLALALEAARLNDVKNKNDLPLITQSILNDVEIAWPELLEEQRHIANAVSDLDELIATLERVISKKRAINQGVKQELLSGRTRLAGFSQPWNKVRLGDHVTYVKTVALSRAQLDAHSPLKYLHYGDIHTRDSVTLDAANADMPRASLTLAAPAGSLRIGDLVFADASEDLAGVGKSVEITSVPEAGLVPGLHTIAARFDPATLAHGFKAYLQFHPQFRNSLVRLVAGTKVLATTRSCISSIELLLPAIPEQRAIARVIREADDESVALLSRFEKAKSIRQGMMQELLTGRTRLVSREVPA